MSLFSVLSRTSRAPFAALLLAFLSLPGVSLGQSDDEPSKEISERVGEQIEKLSTLYEEKQYDEALTLINDLIRTVDPNSYDLAVLTQLKAQVLLTQNKYEESIEPLEVALRLGETYGYLEPRQQQEYAMLLSQLHFQVASGLKDKAKQIEGFDRAIAYLRRYLETADKLRPEARLYAAQAFYQRATVEDEDNPDQELLEEARRQAENGLYSEVKPRETFYVVILAVLQTQGRVKDAAELLELLVSRYPTNRQYWQPLVYSYLTLAEEEDDPERAYELQIRAITAIDRAQELGIMDTPRDHFNLIGIYFNLKRFPEAITLLERGLENGNIENTQQNWELLASSYQQVRKELKAVDVLKEAAKRFPEAGALEYTAAQIYYSLDKLEDAYRHAKAALEKGNLENRSQVLLFAAYMGYELREFEDALEFAEEAAKDPEAENADKLVAAIRDSIEERERALSATIF